MFVEAEADIDLMLPGAVYDVTVTVINTDSAPVRDLTLGIRPRTYKWKGDLVAEAGAANTRDELLPGESWRVPVRVGVGESPRGAFRLAFEVDYDFEGTLHLADEILRTRISDPVDIAFDPQRIIVDGDETRGVAAVLTNNTAAPIDVDVPSASPEGVVLRADPGTVRLPPGESRTVALTVSWPDGLPGVADVKLAPEHYEALTVRRPFHCPYLDRAPRIDGDLADWPESSSSGHLVLGRPVSVADRPVHVPFPLPPPPSESALESGRESAPVRILASPEKTARAFGAEAALGWNEDGLFVGLLVEDPELAQDHFGLEIWRGDSIQFAIDPQAGGSGIRTVTPGQFLVRIREEGYSADDHEFGLARTRAGDQVVRIHGPADSPKGAVANAEMAIQRLEGSTVYELFLPWEEFGGHRTAGDMMGVDILVNNFDGQDRTVLGWADAIGAGKFPSRHVPLVLSPR